MDNGFKYSVVEALILASPEPLPARKIAEMVDKITTAKVGLAVAELNNRYMQAGSSYRIREIAGGYQFYITPEFTGYVQELFTRRRKMRLTRAALETLAIMAYRQPVTKNEVEMIRGVASDGVIHNLLEKKMISIQGRAKTIGKALQYGTTDEFLKFFGLNSVEDLPKMSEIEELVASNERTKQTELHLERQDEINNENIKLNIANGNYNPDKEIEIDETPGEQVVTELKDDSSNNGQN
ncbi:MAG: SMC-Scp complex subunit ScpB [Candidatus Zixiibacteriota bacterium]